MKLFIQDQIISQMILYLNKKKNLILLFVVDGDGTLNELINGVMKLEEKPKISFIPLGTMNDFARTIRMSTNKLFLSKNISDSRIISSDIGMFNDMYFNYVVAFGAFTPVAYVTPHKLKKAIGKLAYFIVATVYLNKIKSYKMKLEVNNKQIEDEFIYGSISNSKSIGGFEWFKRRGVKINDGKFEMLFIKKPENFIKWINTIILLAFRRHYNTKYFYYFQTNKIRINSNQNISWTIDGEYGGRKKEVIIDNKHKAIKFIIPL